MTNDELLAKIDEQITTWSSEEYGWPKQWLSDEVKSKTPMASYFKALRAVVELHKPDTFNIHGQTVSVCPECNSEYCWSDEEGQYPCPTIQAIENELK